jgi:hypothetical protein
MNEKIYCEKRKNSLRKLRKVTLQIIDLQKYKRNIQKELNSWDNVLVQE